MWTLKYRSLLLVGLKSQFRIEKNVMYEYRKTSFVLIEDDSLAKWSATSVWSSATPSLVSHLRRRLEARTLNLWQLFVIDVLTSYLLKTPFQHHFWGVASQGKKLTNILTCSIAVFNMSLIDLEHSWYLDRHFTACGVAQIVIYRTIW